MIYTHELLTLWLVEAYCMLPNMGERDDGNGGMQLFGKGANAIRPYRGKVDYLNTTLISKVLRRATNPFSVHIPLR